MHESFLLKELAADPDVHRVLESSQRLCEKYGIQSMALVQFIPGQGYTPKNDNGCSPQAQQALWLKAMSNAGSQPDGAANGRQASAWVQIGGNDEHQGCGPNLTSRLSRRIAPPSSGLYGMEIADPGRWPGLT